MNIDTGKYVLKSDAQCMWIEEKVTVKKGKNEGSEYTKVVTGYFTNFINLFANFASRRLKGCDAENMMQVLDEVTAIEAELKELAAQIAAEMSEQVATEIKKKRV